MLNNGFIGSSWLVATAFDWLRQVTQNNFGCYCRQRPRSYFFLWGAISTFSHPLKHVYCRFFDTNCQPCFGPFWLVFILHQVMLLLQFLSLWHRMVCPEIQWFWATKIILAVFAAFIPVQFCKCIIQQSSQRVFQTLGNLRCFLQHVPTVYW